jgi:hypothetical protein
MMFFPAPESRVLIPSPGQRNSTRPSMSARQVCRAPHYWHTPTRVRHLHHGCRTAATCRQHPPSSPLPSPRSSVQHSRNTALTTANCGLSMRPCSISATWKRTTSQSSRTTSHIITAYSYPNYALRSSLPRML